ncbi:MAG: hypothetical protein ABIJ97_06035 [Bacteroidota bacterium]
MKKVIFILMYLTVSLNLVSNAQDVSKENEILFVFENQETISNNFADKVNQKVIEFKIKGLSNQSEIDDLKTKILAQRGVIDFVIGNSTGNNEYSATITLYEYADHWMYYKFLFIHIGVNNVIIDNQIIESEKLSNL